MLAYHGSHKAKYDILQQLARHREHDDIKQGVYWQNGKGCAVGCTIHSDNHFEYEDQFGIPYILAKLEDRIFEHLPNKLARSWPEYFMAAINPGARLATVWPELMGWVLIDKDYGLRENSRIFGETWAHFAPGQYDKFLDLLARTSYLYVRKGKKWPEDWDALAKSFDDEFIEWQNSIRRSLIKVPMQYAIFALQQAIQAGIEAFGVGGGSVNTRAVRQATCTLMCIAYCADLFYKAHGCSLAYENDLDDKNRYMLKLSQKLLAILQETK